MTTANTEKPNRFKTTLIWIKKRRGPLAGLLGALAIITTVGWLYFRYPDFFQHLEEIGNRGAFIGYGITFVISIILNATVIIPVSNMTVIAALGGTLPLPWLVGVFGGLGAGIGELMGYVVGRSGRELLAKNKMYVRVESWVKRWGWVAVFILSIFPIAFDVVGIIAGATRMPVWRFFIACWLGRTISYIAVAYLGSGIFGFWSG